jgi:hypothetical protein
MWFRSGTTSCLKPFGLPDRDPYSLASLNQEILVWQKSTHNTFPLIKQLLEDEPNVRQAIESERCNTKALSVGDILELQSATAPMTGQVEQGLKTLRTSDPDLQWDPASYGHLGYDGFNRPDWRTSRRVINVMVYEFPNPYGNTNFKITGFLTLFLNRFEETGPDFWQYGIILPNRPVGGVPCTPPNCSETSWFFRLVQ